MTNKVKSRYKTSITLRSIVAKVLVAAVLFPAVLSLFASVWAEISQGPLGLSTIELSNSSFFFLFVSESSFVWILLSFCLSVLLSLLVPWNSLLSDSLAALVSLVLFGVSVLILPLNVGFWPGFQPVSNNLELQLLLLAAAAASWVLIILGGFGLRLVDRDRKSKLDKKRRYLLAVVPYIWLVAVNVFPLLSKNVADYWSVNGEVQIGYSYFLSWMSGSNLSDLSMIAITAGLLLSNAALLLLVSSNWIRILANLLVAVGLYWAVSFKVLAVASINNSTAMIFSLLIGYLLAELLIWLSTVFIRLFFAPKPNPVS